MSIGENIANQFDNLEKAVKKPFDAVERFAGKTVIKPFTRLYDGKTAETKTKIAGKFEELLRNSLPAGLVELMLENPMFPGVGPEEARLMREQARANGEPDPFKTEIANRAEAARKQAMGIKEMDPRQSELLINYFLNNQSSNLNEWPRGQQHLLGKFIPLALKDGYGNIATKLFMDPRGIYLCQQYLESNPRILAANQYEIFTKYPQILPLSNIVLRERAAQELAAKSMRGPLPDTVVLQGDMLDIFTQQGGDFSQIKGYKTPEKHTPVALIAANSELRKAFPNQPAEVARNLNTAIRGIGGEIVAMSDLVSQMAGLKGGTLPETVLLGRGFPVNGGNIDFKNMSYTQQEEAYRALEIYSLQNEFGINPYNATGSTKSTQQILADINSLSDAQLATTNIGEETIHACGEYSRLAPNLQRQLLVSSIYYHTVAYIRSGDVHRHASITHAQEAQKAIANGIKEAAIHTNAANVAETVANTNTPTPAFYQAIGAVEFVTHELPNLTGAGGQTLSSILEVPANDTIFATSNGNQKKRNMKALVEALGKINNPDPATVAEGEATLSTKFGVTNLPQLKRNLQATGSTYYNTYISSTDPNKTKQNLVTYVRMQRDGARSKFKTEGKNNIVRLTIESRATTHT